MPELAAELAERGTVDAPSSISRWLIRNGYRFKKTLLAREQARRGRRTPGVGRKAAEDAA